MKLGRKRLAKDFFVHNVVHKIDFEGVLYLSTSSDELFFRSLK